MSERDSISDYEILVLIHKGIDMEKLKKHNKKITRKRVDKLLQKLENHVKEGGLSIRDEGQADGRRGQAGDVSGINKRYDSLIVSVDGASRGNPGKAGVGVAIFDKDLNVVKEVSEYIGVATNNVAEYKALILGVKLSMRYNAGNIVFRSDSELMVKQIMGKYRVKSIQLMYLFTEAQSLLKKLPKWEIMHVPREENKEADSLADKGIEMSINKE